VFRINNQRHKSFSSTSSKSKARKAREREIALNKVNLCSVYNRNENFKCLHPFGVQPVDSQAYEKNAQKFKQSVEDDIINIEALQKLSWQGIPMGKFPSYNS